MNRDFNFNDPLYFDSNTHPYVIAHNKIGPAIKAVIEENENPLLVHLSLIENAKNY